MAVKRQICSLWSKLLSLFVGRCPDSEGKGTLAPMSAWIPVLPSSATYLLENLVLEAAVLKVALFFIPFLGCRIWYTFQIESPQPSGHFANLLILVSLHLQILSRQECSFVSSADATHASKHEFSLRSCRHTVNYHYWYIYIYIHIYKFSYSKSVSPACLQIAAQNPLQPQVRKSYVWNISLQLLENNSVYSSVCEHWMNGNSSSNCLFLS